MIFDCFTFFNELDILEIRLNEMSPIVDRFVLVEAKKTFQGAEKPLYFEENKARFSGFLDKIEHVIIDFPEDLGLYRQAASLAWAREYYQRDQISKGLTQAEPDDFVIISDVDEIMSADVIADIVKHYKSETMLVLCCTAYSFYFNRKVKTNKSYLGPRMTQMRFFRSAQEQRWSKLFASRALRNTLIGEWHTRLWNKLNIGFGGKMIEVPNAGWHFTSIGGWEAFRAKMQAFAHEEQMDLDIFKELQAFEAEMDLTTDRVPINEMPKFLQNSHERFADLLDL